MAINPRVQLLELERGQMLAEVQKVQEEHRFAMQRLRTTEESYNLTSVEVQEALTARDREEHADIEEKCQLLEIHESILTATHQRLERARKDLQRHRRSRKDEEAALQALLDLANGELGEVRRLAGGQRDTLIDERMELFDRIRALDFPMHSEAGTMRRRAALLSDETAEKHEFEERLFSRAVAKLKSIEDERGRIVEGYLNKRTPRSTHPTPTASPQGSPQGGSAKKPVSSPGGHDEQAAPVDKAEKSPGHEEQKPPPRQLMRRSPPSGMDTDSDSAPVLGGTSPRERSRAPRPTARPAQRDTEVVSPTRDVPQPTPYTSSAGGSASKKPYPRRGSDSDPNGGPPRIRWTNALPTRHKANHTPRRE